MDRTTVSRRSLGEAPVKFSPVGYVVSEETKKSLLAQCKSPLPILAPLLADHYGIKKRSMETNEKLATNWEVYKDRVAAGAKKPVFQFPKYRDYHFHNGVIKYAPAETPATRHTFKHKMRAGPGIDHNCKELPIPYFEYRTKLIQRPKVLKRKSTPKKKIS